MSICHKRVPVTQTYLTLLLRDPILRRPSQLPQQGSDLCRLSSFPHAATSSFVLPNVYQSATISSSQWLQIPFPHHTWITLISVVEAMPRDCKKRALLPSSLWLSSYLHMHSVPAVRVRSVETRETVLLNASKGHLQLPPLNHSIKTLGLSVGFSKNTHILRKIQSIWTTYADCEKSCKEQSHTERSHSLALISMGFTAPEKSQSLPCTGAHLFCLQELHQHLQTATSSL